MFTLKSRIKQALILSLAAPAAALAGMPEPSTPMPIGAPAAAPEGWVQFCRRDRFECERGAPTGEAQFANQTIPQGQGRARPLNDAAQNPSEPQQSGLESEWWSAPPNAYDVQHQTAVSNDEGPSPAGILANDLATSIASSYPTAGEYRPSPGWSANSYRNDEMLVGRIEPDLFAGLDTPYLQPAGGQQVEATAEISDEPGLASKPLARDRRLSWASHEDPNLRIKYASTYSLRSGLGDLAPAMPQANGTWDPPRVNIDSAMGRLQSYRAEGEVTASGPTQIGSGPVLLTPALWNEVRSVNERINRAIVKRSDKELYGVEEDWTLPLETGVNAGDCEDFVLEKRRALLEAGVPRSALSIAVVTTYRGMRHAVLVLATDRGDYVLDSLTPWILPWAKAGYRWEERQVAGSTETWASLSPPQVLRRTADGKAAVLLIAL